MMSHTVRLGHSQVNLDIFTSDFLDIDGDFNRTENAGGLGEYLFTNLVAQIDFLSQLTPAQLSELSNEFFYY